MIRIILLGQQDQQGHGHDIGYQVTKVWKSSALEKIYCTP